MESRRAAISRAREKKPLTHFGICWIRKISPCSFDIPADKTLWPLAANLRCWKHQRNLRAQRGLRECIYLESINAWVRSARRQLFAFSPQLRSNLRHPNGSRIAYRIDACGSPLIAARQLQHSDSGSIRAMIAIMTGKLWSRSLYCAAILVAILVVIPCTFAQEVQQTFASATAAAAAANAGSCFETCCAGGWTKQNRKIKRRHPAIQNK